MSDNKDQPIVIIGAGLSGLAASLMLARADLPVVLLEASENIGGCCSTTSESGFTFNNGAIYVALPSLLRHAFTRLGLDFDTEVPLTPIDHPHRTYLDDGTVVNLADVEHSSVEGPRARQRTAMLRDGLGRLQQWWHPVYRALTEDLLLSPPSLWRTLSRLWRFLPRMSGPVDQLITRHFPDPGLQAAIASTLLYTGTAPEHLPATQIIGLLALLEEGFHVPQGGMSTISSALERAARQAGVQIRTNSRVERIEVSGGKVHGVVLADGEHMATNRVLATCSGFELVERLLPPEVVPRRLAARSRHAPRSHRAIAIQLGCSVPDLPDAFIVNHVPPMTEQGRMHQTQSGTPRWISYTNPTPFMPESAPVGHTVIECFAPVSGISSVEEWTKDMTQRSVDRHLEALQAHLPSLTVDTMRVIDPLDFAHRYLLYDGALYGIAPGTAPNKLFPHRTRIDGLYMAGQTTYPGYGVPSVMLSGIQAAEALAQDTGITLAE